MTDPGSLRRRAAVALALLALVACATATFRVAAQSAPSRPPDLPVTRLEGPSGSPASPAAPIQRPGAAASLPITQLDDRPSDLDGARTISLALSQPMPVRDLLLLLVRGTPFSIVADDAVGGTFTGELKDLTMRQALEAVLFPRDLDYDLQGHLIRVFARRLSTRLFPVDYINLRRTWQRGVRAAIAIPGQAPAAEFSSASESDLFDELAKGVSALMSSSGRMHVDRTAGLVQVTDFADRLDQVEVYVEMVHLRATRQVRLEARVFEVTLNDAAATAVDWQAVAKRSGASVVGAGTHGAAGLTVQDLPALLRAIGEQGTVRMISANHIVAMNNEPAVMRAGTQEVYLVPASQIEQAGRVERSSSAATVALGLTLTITPQIAADGIVQLNLAPTYAEKTGQTRAKSGEPLPVLSITEADTSVRVRDGETVVISGFLQERVKTKQGAGMAGFFGAQTRETAKAELVILLTPSVVVPGATAVPGVR